MKKNVKKNTNNKNKANPVKVEANFLLVIAITTVVALALNMLALILHYNGEEQGAQVFDALSLPAGVAGIVFMILNFTKWKVVRDKTKLSYHFVTTGYIVQLAIAAALGIALGVLIQNGQEKMGHTIIHSISMGIDLFTVIYSFILQSKVRQYAK